MNFTLTFTIILLFIIVISSTWQFAALLHLGLPYRDKYICACACHKGVCGRAGMSPVIVNLRTKRRMRVFENRVLWGIFGPRRDEETGEWRTLHNEELNDLYCSPNIVRVIKSRRMRWVGHVARMGEGRGVYRVLVGKPEETNHLGVPGVDGKIILTWIFRKKDVGVWTGSSWLRIGTGGVQL